MTDDEAVAQAAEHVMGWKVIRMTSGKVVAERRPGDSLTIVSAFGPRFTAWNPLRSDSDCFQVVDRMLELGFRFTLGQEGATWRAEFDATCVAGCRRRSIVLAALMTVGAPL